MSGRSGIILGFNPGGKKSFGWSICHAGPDELTLLRTGLSGDTKGAFDSVIESIKSLEIPGNPGVLAAGINAPMFWSTTGDREVDRVIRKALPPGQKDTVLHINSIPGACLVQGASLGKLLHERYGGDGFRITESHPSALFQLLEARGQSQELEVLQALIDAIEDYAEQDAAICAYGAWSMLQRSSGWQDLYLLEPRSVQPFGTPLSYWMPVA